MTPPIVFLPHRWRLSLGWAVAAMLLLSPLAGASQANADGDRGLDEAPISQVELEQILAPIALYPDDLLSQILMASTYPIEIVEAARFSSANPGLTGPSLTERLEAKNWDPSVNSLVNFPDLLQSLSEQLNWTRKIGDAFLDDEGRVLDTVQSLRRNALDSGHLKSSVKYRVYSEHGTAIRIESTNPRYVYVPAYDPSVVYGIGWQPGFEPRAYYRPRHFRHGSGIQLGEGYLRGSAWGFAWGQVNWRGRRVDLDLNHNMGINPYIHRDIYRGRLNVGRGVRPSAWRHDPVHRRGVAYGTGRSASRFNGRSRFDAQRSRRSYRGYVAPTGVRNRTQATIGRRSATTRSSTNRDRGRRVGPFTRNRTSHSTARSAARGRSSRRTHRNAIGTRRRRSR